MFLRVGRETVGLDPTATTGPTIPLQQANRNDEVKSALEVLRSRNVVGKVVDTLGVDTVLGRTGIGSSKSNMLADVLGNTVGAIVNVVKSIDPISEREEAIIVVERHLEVSAERESTVIVVEYEAETPQLAQAVCAAVVDCYRSEHMRIHRNEDSQPFFIEQQERLRKQLDDSIAALQAAKSEMGLANIDQRRATLEEQYSAVELDRLATDREKAATQARITDLERQLAETPEWLVDSKKSVPNQGADLLRDQLYALQVKALDLKARYSDTHPLVQAVNAQLADAQKVMNEQTAERVETTDNINPIHRQLALDLKQQEAALASNIGRLAQLSQQKEAVLAELRAVNEHEIKLDQLTRQADLARGKFFQYSEKMEETRMDKELEADRISNVADVQVATLAEKPVRPSKALVGLATMVLAGGGTGALVLASEQLSSHRRSLAAPVGNGVVQPLAIARRRRVHHRGLTVKSNGHIDS